jgi:hypothetical protein
MVPEGPREVAGGKTRKRRSHRARITKDCAPRRGRQSAFCGPSGAGIEAAVVRWLRAPRLPPATVCRASGAEPSHAAFAARSSSGISIFVIFSIASITRFAFSADGGEPGPCGWVKDRYGLSWQVNPTILGRLLADPDRGVGDGGAGRGLG